MFNRNAYLKIVLTASCLLSAGLYAAEEGLEEDVLMEEEGTATEEGMQEEGAAATEEMAAEEGMEEEGMLEEEAIEEVAPFYANSVEVGIEYSTEDSFKFGEYTGIVDEGPYAIGNLFIHKRMPTAGGNTQYWDLIGTNLGLDMRSVLGRYGEAGKYELFIEYDQLPHYQLDDARTPFAGVGSDHITLPAAYVNASGNTSGILFNGTLHQEDVDTQRYNIGGGFSWYPAAGWSITANHHHEFKDGTETGGISTAAFSSAFIAIIPVDYETDEFDLRIARAGEKGQFELGYHLSLFENDNRGLVYENPFSNGGANPLRSLGQLGLAPDNHSHAFNFTGAYNLGLTTRAMATLSYQRMSQDDTFLPFTNNSNVAVVAALPRNSLDGDINNYFANFTLTGRPMQKLNLTGRYTFDLRDGDTPSDTYRYVRTDRDNSQAADGSRARVNKVYDYLRHKAELDARYRLMPRATLSANYTYDYVDRSQSERDNTYEHSGYVKLMGSPTDRTNGWIRYLHGEKDGSDYDARLPFFYGFSPEHVADVAVNDCGDPAGGPYDINCPDYYENSSFLRKYYMADRSRDQIAGNFSFFPNDKFTVGVSGRYTTDDFNDSTLGLTDRDIYSATLDLSYMHNENIKTYAYYTHDYMYNHQIGCEGCNPEPTATLPSNRLWKVINEDHVNTLGAGFEWLNVIENKVDLYMNFTYTKSETEVDPEVPDNFVDPNILPFQDITTKIYHVDVHGDYRVNKQMRLRAGYLYEYYNNLDWAFNNIDPTTIDIILATGERSQNYTAHVVGLSLIYDF